jgi:anti-sigma-K factor RskA
MTHVDSLVTDYVLGLLSRDERRAVERHVADCPECMDLLAAALRREARLSSMFRKSMVPASGRLEVLWPQVALALEGHRSHRAGWFASGWRDGWRMALAVLGVALVVLAGAFGTVRGLDGWLLSTHTPTLAAATPTASLTPALSHTPNLWMMTVTGDERAVAATPAPVACSPSPAPLPVHRP